MCYHLITRACKITKKKMAESTCNTCGKEHLADETEEDAVFEIYHQTADDEVLTVKIYGNQLPIRYNCNKTLI